MIKSTTGSDGLDGVVHKLFPFLFWRPLNPHALTVCGVFVSGLAAFAYAEGRVGIAGILVLAGGFFDLVDGVVARHFGVTSRFGAFLDSTLDRLVDMMLLIGISVHFAAQGEPGHVLLTGFVLATGVLVSYSKARAELVVPDFDAGTFERGERIGVLAWGSILGFLTIALWILAIGSTITVIQRFAAAHREMKRLDQKEGEGCQPSEPVALEERKR